MALTFTLPDLGEGLVDAEIVTWLVGVGDQVASDQPLVEVETAKATVQIPSPWAGTVLRLGGAVGDVLAVGAVLVELSGDDEPSGDDASGPAPAPEHLVPERPVPGGSRGGTATTDAGASVAGPRPDGLRRRALASPSTRARATALGLDITAIVGTGPGGRVTRDDVERAARSPEPSSPPKRSPGRSPEPSSPPVGPSEPLRPMGSAATAGDGDRDVPLRGIRREIARTMTASWQQIPHVTEFREVDATELMRAHRALREHWPEDRPRLTVLPLLALASVVALRRHPSLNASLDMPGETIRYHGAVHLGIATAAADGLTVPVVRDADRMGLPQLAGAISAAVDAARARRAGADQLRGGTFTLSNFGSYGTWLGTPVINPPQAAIAGFGRIRDTVVAVDGQPVVRPTLPVAVSADHRLIDGDVLGAFVSELATLLTDPVLLLGEI